jgi:3-oxoacyl-[acyl-carrier protein] reductase
LDLGLEGRRALVVGGSQGIGKAAAALLAEEGAEVAIASRSAERLAAAAVEIGRDRREPGQVVCDVTEPGAGERLAEAVAARWGGLDVLVCAVGGSIRAAFADLSDEEWLANYGYNVLATVRPIRALLPALERGRDPAVVVLGAASSKMPYPHQIVSNVHKAGLLALTKTLGSELAGKGIRVNCVAPGRTLTPLWTTRADRMAAEEGRSREAVLEEFAKDIPMRRFGAPEEVAAMVVWLACPRASYVTGQAVNVDGGIARGLL